MNEVGRLAGHRVIIITGGLGLGGAERQALLLARYLHNTGADVQFWGLTDTPGRVSELCEEHGIAWRAVPFHMTWNRWHMVMQLARLALALRRACPAVVLPYTNVPNVACGLIWRFTGARACLWNQRDVGNIGRMPGQKERLAIRGVSHCLANSQAAAEFLISEYAVPRSRVTVIHNVVALPEARLSREQWRQQLELAPDTRVACMVANLTEFKDHDTLLRAWRLVLDGRREAGLPVLLLAGDCGSTTQALKALAYDLDLGRSVRFLGAVEDVSGLLRAADVGVFSSRQESLPNGILECMAAGLPVVATDIPGNREALGEAMVAYLVPVGDACRLASEVTFLLSDSDKAAAVGRQNAERCRVEFGAGSGMSSVVAAMTVALGARA